MVTGTTSKDNPKVVTTRDPSGYPSESEGANTVEAEQSEGWGCKT